MHRKSIIAITLALALAVPMVGVTNASEQAAADEEETVVLSTVHVLESFDGTKIHITVHRASSATATDPVPLVLHSHGWGGSRASAPTGIVGDLLGAGFAVLSIDQRGHGDSGGHATVMHKDYELKDLQVILDWSYDNLQFLQKEGDPADKDLVLGAVGGSYGGAYQLLLASHDDRVDAIAPQMTWNDLRYSLAPQGVVKSVWVDALYGAGKAQIDMDPRIDGWYREAMLTNTIPADAEAHFEGSNPIPGNIHAATLLVQGHPDLLFNWNEAARNYAGIKDGGNDDVALVGYLGGHVLPGVQPLGFMGPQRAGEPCGDYADLALAWLDRHLNGNATAAVPSGISYATEQGDCIQTDGSELWMTPIGNQFESVPAPSGAGSILLPLDSIEGDLLGSPTIGGSYTGVTEGTHFFSLVLVDEATGRTHIIDDQTMPLRVGPSAGSEPVPFTLEMAGVATSQTANDALYLRIDGLNEWYAHNGDRAPTPGLFTDLSVGLPYLAG